MNLDDLIKKISEESKTNENEVKKLIEDKQIELSGLVSPEGAAYIIGRELGVNLIKEVRRSLKIKNLVSGMNNVDLTAKIIKIFEPRNFEKNGKSGVVNNIILGDETGTVRMSLWNDETDLIKKNDLKEGVCIKLTGGYTKEDNRGNPELRIGRKGKIEVIETEINIDLNKEGNLLQNFIKKNICDFEIGDYNEVNASLVQLFRRQPFFEVCPKCEAKVEENNGKWICKEHGEIKPNYRIVISGIIDDGTGNIRAVFFGEAGKKILGNYAEKIKDVNFYDNVNILGKDYVIKGRVKKNDFTEELEFIVSDVHEINVKKECEKLLSEIKDLKT